MNSKIDQKTQLLEKLLIEIAETAKKHNKKYYFGGGFAIDIFFGSLTRSHEDLDFYPMEKDTDWWKDWFSSQGYIVSKDPDMKNLVHAFSVLGTTNEYFADVYPIAIGDNGKIELSVKPGTLSVWDGMLTIQDNRGLWEGKSWNEIRSVVYKGHTIIVENYKTILAQKEKYIKLHPRETLPEKHLLDFKRAGIKPQTS